MLFSGMIDESIVNNQFAPDAPGPSIANNFIASDHYFEARDKRFFFFVVQL